MCDGYLSDAQHAYIRTGGSRAISCPHQPIQHAGQTFHKYTPRERKTEKSFCICFDRYTHTDQVTIQTIVCVI